MDGSDWGVELGGAMGSNDGSIGGKGFGVKVGGRLGDIVGVNLEPLTGFEVGFLD